MKLLITTQAVDEKDPVLGFFVAWLKEFSKHCEQVTVICLRKGQYDLPQNVRVFPLHASGKFGRMKELIKGAYRFRNNYDAVFVHMNPEYLVAAGWLWRLLGKKTALWYTHKSVDLKLRVATFFANDILTASKESFRLPNRKVHVMGHGIDADFFSPDSNIARGDWWLSVGRLTKSKRHDLAIRAAHEAGKEIKIAGEGPEHASLETLARELGARTTFLGPLSHTQLRDEYRKAALLVHTSETGSLDKVVLEALACGCSLRTNDPALKFFEKETPDYVRREHSLSALIPKILSILKA